MRLIIITKNKITMVIAVIELNNYNLVCYAREVKPFWSLLKKSDVLSGKSSFSKKNNKPCWRIHFLNSLDLTHRGILIHSVGQAKLRFSENCLIPVKRLTLNYNHDNLHLDKIIGVPLSWDVIHAKLSALDSIQIKEIRRVVC